MSLAIVQQYYNAFNAGDRPAMLALLADDVRHDINQGGHEIGREAFARFLHHMDGCYREELRDIVLMSNADGSRIAAEFVVYGTYLATDPGFPEAHGQTYVLPAGAFLEVRNGRIARVTTYYNVREWVRLVGG